MPNYTKLWSHILDSSIWREPNELRLLWIILLAKKDKDHNVHCSVPTLADMIRVTPDECMKLLEKLMAPDKWSANKEHGGRRLLPIEGGWFVVSGEKYQNYMRDEHRKEAVRAAVARHRDKKRARDPLGRNGNGRETMSPPSP